MGFTTGTLILTDTGYRPIEHLVKGDAVMTHARSFRRVEQVIRGFGEPLVHMKAQGCGGIGTTATQGFLTDEGLWLPSVRLRQPIQRRVVQVYPAETFMVDPYAEEHASPRFWWLVGRYLGCGWLSHRYGRAKSQNDRICFAVHPEKAWSLEPKFRELGYGYDRQLTRTSVRLTVHSVGLGSFLEQFGNKSDDKRLPGWVYSLERTDAQRLIEGYLSGAGNDRANGDVRVNTVSKPLAFGMALLVHRAHELVCSIYYQPTASVTEIESRLVKQRDYWSLTVPFRNRSGRVDGSRATKLVRETRSIGKGATWALRVAGENSYLADNAIVQGATS